MWTKVTSPSSGSVESCRLSFFFFLPGPVHVAYTLVINIPLRDGMGCSRNWGVVGISRVVLPFLCRLFLFSLFSPSSISTSASRGDIIIGNEVQGTVTGWECHRED